MADLETRIRVILEDKDLQRAENRLKDLTKEQGKLNKEFKDGEKNVGQYLRGIKDLRDEEDKLHRVIDDVSDALDKQSQATKRANDAFNKTSEGVALAGDVESGLRTVGGAAGAFGGAGIESALSKGGELFAVVEALPRLKAAAAGLPSVMKNAAKSLGPTGIFTLAVVAGLALIIAAARRANAEVKAATGARLAVEEEVAGRVVRGGNADEVQREIDELKRLLPEQERLFTEARAQRLEAFEKRTREGLGSDLLGRTREILGITDSTEIQAAFARRKAALETTRKRIELLSAALEAGAFTTEEAVEEEKKLAQARGQSTAAAVAQQKQFKPTGITFGAASLSLIGQNPEQMKKEAEAQKEFEEAKAKLEHEAAQDELDLRQDMADERFRLELDNFRDIEDSIRDFTRSRSDALEEGNFLQLRDINRQEKRAAEDRKTELRRSNQDINREGQRAQRELQAQAANSMQLLNAEVAKGLTGVVNQFQNALASIAGTSTAPAVPFGVSLFATSAPPRTSF